MRRSLPPASKGFSLVEVTLALGLVAFCLVALLGLLPVGLDATGRASRHAEAARLLEQLSSGIQNAQETADGEFLMIAPSSEAPLAWSIGGSDVVSSASVGANGDVPDASFPALFVYRIDLIPPEDTRPASYGRAIVRVAWPPTATFQPGEVWGEGGWSLHEGHVQALVLFREKQ